MVAAGEVLAHRRDVAALVLLAHNDVRVLVGKAEAAVAVRNSLIKVLPDLVETYGSAAASLGADWYDELRSASGVNGRFRATAAALPDRGRTSALARWGVTPLFAKNPDPAKTVLRVAGGMQRIIADADRYTITGSSIADPRAQGWERVGAGGCAFCEMLIGRGAVYSEASADFESHDHCQCAAVPVFD